LTDLPDDIVDHVIAWRNEKVEIENQEMAKMNRRH